jgi:hypothetical protein
MSAIDLVIDEVQSRFGLSGTKARSLLSGLLSFITSQNGGISGFIERFRSVVAGSYDCSSFVGGDSCSAECAGYGIGHHVRGGCGLRGTLPVAVVRVGSQRAKERELTDLKYQCKEFPPGGVSSAKNEHEYSSLTLHIVKWNAGARGSAAAIDPFRSHSHWVYVRRSEYVAA